MLNDDTRRKRLKHILFNGAALGAPLIGALISVPILIRHLEPAAFSLLGLYWVILGYASMVELGLGRSITWRLASLGPDNSAVASQTLSTALVAAFGFGAIGSVLLATALPMIFGGFIVVPSRLEVANAESLAWIALSVPTLTVTSVLLGALEAQGRFGLIAIFRIPAGLALFLVPAIMVQSGMGFGSVMAGIFWVRVVLAAALFVATARYYPPAKGSVLFSSSLLRSLLGYGGWLSLSALIGPLLVYLDRFLLSYKWGLDVTAIYTPAFESVVRLLVIASAVSGIMFPRFAADANKQGRSSSRLYAEANLIVGSILAPFVIIILVFGDQIFQLWIGGTNLPPNHVIEAALVAKVLVCAVLVNGCAHIPQAYIQAQGLARWTAILHVVELCAFVIYGPALIFAYGIYGAAFAWLIRSSISAVALYYLAWRLRSKT